MIDEAYWDEICRFVSSTGFELAWDLNALRMRTPANTWNASNAEAQLKYVAARPAQAGLLKAVQLGNEPGHSMVETPGAPTPEQHGHDFLQLRALLGRTVRDQLRAQLTAAHAQAKPATAGARVRGRRRRGAHAAARTAPAPRRPPPPPPWPPPPAAAAPA